LKSSPEAFRESNKAAPIIVAEKESAYGSRFIVVLNNQQSRLALGKSSSKERVREIANDIVRRSGIRARGDDFTILAGALNGFVIESNPRELAGIVRDPRILFIEQDSEVTTQDVQTNPNSWGLDRTNQRQLPLNQSFAFDHDVGPLHAYIIDTGVRPSHSDFQQTGGGTRAASVFNCVGGSNDDCNGHGTHVTGTMAGNEYGVAKDANIYGVKVLNCSGGGSVSSVVSGVN
jgi:subtilisin family serine protease